MDDKNARSFITLESAKKNLEEWLLYSNEVTFTSWEPTIHPQIIDLVILAKKIWYKTIQIISNGRKYRDIDFLISLLNAWVTDFIISLHWNNSLLHNRIVRKNWAFEDTIRWMINLGKLKKDFDFVLNTTSTIIKWNYKKLYNIVQLLEKFPIDSIVLNVLIPEQEWYKNREDIFIAYSRLKEEFEKIRVFHEKYGNIYINGFPFCISDEIIDMLGFREPVLFKQDEKNFARHSDNHSVHFSINDEENVCFINWKLKRNECNNCKYFNECEWIWKSYIDVYGWDEFSPINN
jgi:MoaA/NifB/PqqE/SkfB family radical SAM enzyme